MRLVTGIVGVVLLLVLTACGGPAGEVAVDDGEPDPAADENGAAAEPDEEPDPPSDHDHGTACELEISVDGTSPDDDDYVERMMEINYELELLVIDLEEELIALEEGAHDGSSLADALEEHALAYTEATEPVTGMTPPAGAEDWHAQVTGSWVEVCEAIQDGIAGAGEGDTDRFDAFVDALREFPALANHLHANTAVGPFEEG